MAAEAPGRRRVAALAPWLGRAVLLAATLVFAMIGRKFIADPVGAAAASDITLGSAVAVTNMRASFGAFPLGCALVTLACLVSARRQVAGLAFVAIMIGCVLAVRILGVLADGSLAASEVVLTAESVLLALALAGLAAHAVRRR
jgi:hypothetical protein